MTVTSTSTTQSQTQTRDESAAVTVPAKEGRTMFFEAVAKSPESSSPDGDYSPKALAFWARKAALRKQPHHCTRCAKPHEGGGQCPDCRAYAAEYRARKREKPVTVDSTALARLERRIGNLEHYFAQLSAEKRIAYNRGYCAGRRLHRKAQERASYFNALPEISRGELAEISHEYQAGHR
jgi:hypothetical protein